MNQKNPRVRKIRVRNSGAGNGCADFMDAWKNAFFLQEKPMSIKFLVFGGGGGYFGFGGGGADCIFMGARIFLNERFSFAHAFSERFFQELGWSPRARVIRYEFPLNFSCVHTEHMKLSKIIRLE